MATTTMRLLVRSLAGPQSGQLCRICSEQILRKDHFGLSEGVCSACRAA